MKCSLLAGVFLASLALANTFTLEQVLSAPFPSELVAAPGGGKGAWLLNERGARNIWIAAAPDFKGVRLTNYTRDDGQDVGQLRWTPDAKAVVYVRGGDLDFLGRPDPNPAADPAGVDQSIWIATPGENPRKIAAGHSPVISPKGDQVAYLLGGQIWLAPLSGVGVPSLPIQARAGVTAAEVRWSPDGSCLAFVSGRGDHSFIAVYTEATGAVTYLDPSTDRDADPAWSPDSTRIVFLRSPPNRSSIPFEPHRSGFPWSIRIVDVATAKAHEIWHADDGPGSVFHATDSDDHLHWTAGDRIVFPW